MPTAYITGATGCVGRNLLDVLLKNGWSVTALHRRTSDLSRLVGCDVKTIEVDLHDLADVRSKLGEADALFHCAANVSHWSRDRDVQWADNVLATRNLATASLGRIGRFIFTSTAATTDWSGHGVAEAKRCPNGYIRTKRLSELEVYEAVDRGLDAVILRPIVVVGKYDWNNYATLFRHLRRHKRFLHVPHGSMIFCHARDIAEGHLAAYHRGRTCQNYLLGGTPTTWLDFFQRVARVVGVRARLRVASRARLYAAGFMLEALSVLTRRRPLLTRDVVRLMSGDTDCSPDEIYRTSRELGYVTRPLDQAIQDCHEWMLSENRYA